MRPGLTVLVLLSLSITSLAGCAAPPPADTNGTQPAASTDPGGPGPQDLPVGTVDPHQHGAPTTAAFCGGYTLGVGDDPAVFAALHDPPADVQVEERTDPEQEWLPVDLPHPDVAVQDAWVHYAYYRSFDDEDRVEKGFSMAATDPPTLSLLGTWPVQDDPPFEVVKLVERVVEAGTAPAVADVLWNAWLEEQVNGTGDAHILFHGSHRLPTAWQQLFGGYSMPPRRAEGEIRPAGKAVVESQGWVWSVTAPHRTWTNGTTMVHADAFGRFSVTIPDYRPRSALESALIEWRIPIPQELFVSLQEGKPCE